MLSKSSKSMTKTPIQDWLSESGTSQRELAESVNLTQGAISKMILKGRDVYVLSRHGKAMSIVEEKLIAGRSLSV